jgi:putative hydrolase of the HAD superfamily
MPVLLFDFFGTLVSYSASRTAQGYPRSHALLPQLDYPSFLALTGTVFAEFDRRSDADDSEFAMAEVAAEVLRRGYGRAPSDDEVAAFESAYLAEWSSGVVAPDGLRDLLAGLRAGHRLAVVSNTHSPAMVPELLDRFGVAEHFEAVVLSVDLGRRKPHPAVYRAALDVLGCGPADAVFVGDTYDADYAGPTAAGIPAYLIDPAGAAAVPADRRLASVFDLPARLT